MITALASCVMFGMMTLMMGLFVDPMPVEAAPSAAANPAHEIDWGKTGLLLLVVLGFLLALGGISEGTQAIARRRQKMRERAEEMTLALDPAAVARSLLPDMSASVDEALSRIALLRSLNTQINRQDDADALVMVERRIPSVMSLYLKASQAASETEKQELARTALNSVVEIGQMAEDARERIIGDLRRDLDTESRYISSRSGWSRGLRAD